METIKLKDGRTIDLIEDGIKGMAGESMTIVLLRDRGTGKYVDYDSIKDLLKQKDREELDQYFEDIYKANEASAISYVI